MQKGQGGLTIAGNITSFPLPQLNLSSSANAVLMYPFYGVWLNSPPTNGYGTARNGEVAERLVHPVWSQVRSHHMHPHAPTSG